ncbi:MAG: hypothetical protein ACC707_16290 [Thiohalomonadales bacterium]
MKFLIMLVMFLFASASSYADEFNVSVALVKNNQEVCCKTTSSIAIIGTKTWGTNYLIGIDGYFAPGLGAGIKVGKKLNDWTIFVGTGLFTDSLTKGIDVNGTDVSTSSGGVANTVYTEAHYKKFFARYTLSSANFDLFATRTDGNGNTFTGTENVSTNDSSLWIGLKFNTQ